VQVAGRIIDSQRGSTMAEMFAPQLQTRRLRTGTFKLQFAIVLFWSLGMHHLLSASCCAASSISRRPDSPRLATGWSDAAEAVTRLTGEVLATGVQLAAPVMIALLLTDLCFGLINRVAPQINVFFLSMPVKMVVGLLVVLIALPLFGIATSITSTGPSTPSRF
jgi:flagellar biosynthetic protein FliR